MKRRSLVIGLVAASCLFSCTISSNNILDIRNVKCKYLRNYSIMLDSSWINEEGVECNYKFEIKVNEDTYYTHTINTSTNYDSDAFSAYRKDETGFNYYYDYRPYPPYGEENVYQIIKENPLWWYDSFQMIVGYSKMYLLFFYYPEIFEKTNYGLFAKSYVYKEDDFSYNRLFKQYDKVIASDIKVKMKNKKVTECNFTIDGINIVDDKEEIRTYNVQVYDFDKTEIKLPEKVIDIRYRYEA